MIEKIIGSDSFWTILAVVIGFSLGEGSSLVRYHLRIRRLKRVVREELRSISAQIDQKKEIIEKALAHLAEKKILPTRSIPILAEGYAKNIPELYPHLIAAERNSLHVIYEQLKVSDEILSRFDTDIADAIRDKIINDPFQVFMRRLHDFNRTYDVVKNLIEAHLAGEPVDVFYLKSKEALQQREGP